MSGALLCVISKTQCSISLGLHEIVDYVSPFVVVVAFQPSVDTLPMVFYPIIMMGGRRTVGIVTILGKHPINAANKDRKV